MIPVRTMLTNGVFCPMPWTGLMYNHDGMVKNCIRSSTPIGDLKNDDIQSILHGKINQKTQNLMLSDRPADGCHGCYDLESGKKSWNVASDRLFYLRELKNIDKTVYKADTHALNVIDVRWSNLCNFSCIYCGPEFSSRWAIELNQIPKKPSDQQLSEFKKYILDNVPNLKHVYLAGGEPLLMKENMQLLEALYKQNPEVNLRINTNLSMVDTKIFDLICEFKNVHWTISVESLHDEYEYIRHGGSWPDFTKNLSHIMTKSHLISFNMLHFLLNPFSLFDCVDWLLDRGFHPNSFVIGPLLGPKWLDIRHLPEDMLKSIDDTLSKRINERPGYLLEDSYVNLLKYIRLPFDKTLVDSMHKIKKIDARRKLDSTKIFRNLYSIK